MCIRDRIITAQPHYSVQCAVLLKVARPTYRFVGRRNLAVSWNHAVRRLCHHFLAPRILDIRMVRPLLDSLGGIPVPRSWTMRAYRLQHGPAMDTADHRLDSDAFGARNRRSNRLYMDRRCFDWTTHSNRRTDDDGRCNARDSTRKIEIRGGIGFLTAPSCGNHAKVPDSTYQ